MKKIKILFLFCIFGLFVLEAQEPEGYYKDAYNKAGYTLKTALYNVIDGHTALSYDALWTAFRTTDKTTDGKVLDIYSNCDFSFGGDQCGNYKNECDCYNREHSFPKSWFNDAKPMYSDLFHLYPTDGKVNGMRSNYPFGEVSSPTYTSIAGCKLGSNSTSGYNGTVFEPQDQYKGDLARSYFYMVTRYEDKVSNWNTDMLNHTSNQAFSNWAKELLIKWHKQDPVSQKEIDRNNAVYGFQKNRNPFIDHPELVDKIWGSDNAPWNGQGGGGGDTTIPEPPVVDSSKCSTLAELLLRSGNSEKVYTYTGKAYVTMIGTQRGQKYIQDATAAIMIDDEGKKVTTTFAIGDYITNISGKWLNYFGLLEFIPTANAEKAQGSYVPKPYEIELSQLANKTFMDKIQSKLISVKDVSFADAGSFVNGKTYRLKNDNITDTLLRVHFYGVDYIGSTLPTSKQDIKGIAVLQKGKYYIAPRFAADMKLAAPEDPNIKDSIFVLFLVEDGKDKRPINNAEISGFGTSVFTTIDGLYEMDLEAGMQYSYGVSHNQYQSFTSSFTAFNDTTITVSMNIKTGIGNTLAKEDVSVYTKGKTVYTLGEGSFESIEIYTLMGEKIYTKKVPTLLKGWSHNLDRSGLYIIRVQKSGSISTLKVVVR